MLKRNRLILYFSLSLATVSVTSLVAAFFGHHLAQSWESVRQSRSSGRLSQLALGLRNYYDDNGRFPPLRDAVHQDGPRVSWRVRLLPYMEMPEIYEQYDFSEAWNGAHNAALARALGSKAPSYFCAPDYPKEHSSWTDYLAIDGTEPNGLSPDRCWLCRSEPTPHGLSSLKFLTLAYIGWSRVTL